MFCDPDTILAQLEIVPGMHIADVGSGTGFFSIVASKLVGPTGRVYAIDVQKTLLDKLSTRATEEGAGNIQTIWGNVEQERGTKIKDGVVDLALAVNIFFQVEDNEGLACELARITKPGGNVLVVDWTDSFGGLGPQPDHVISLDEVATLIEGQGLKREREVKAGAHHYGVIFSKAG